MSNKILEIKDLRKNFRNEKKIFPAVDGINFFLKRGECLGLVGESGCGKSTTAKLLTLLSEPDEGSILFEGREIVGVKGKAKKTFYREVQMVFQSPKDSFDPRRKLGHGIMESLRNQGMGKQEAKERLKGLLKMVELPEEFAERYPHEVSGGQCQRAAIARALAVEPKVLICDEATSALDVTVQAQIVELLKKLQKEMELSILLICHDLALVQAMCDRVLVMYQGKIVEEGGADEVILTPKEAYTKRLIESVF